MRLTGALGWISRGRVPKAILLAMLLGWGYLDWGGRLGFEIFRR